MSALPAARDVGQRPPPGKRPALRTVPVAGGSAFPRQPRAQSDRILPEDPPQVTPAPSIYQLGCRMRDLEVMAAAAEQRQPADAGISACAQLAAKLAQAEDQQHRLLMLALTLPARTAADIAVQAVLALDLVEELPGELHRLSEPQARSVMESVAIALRSIVLASATIADVDLGRISRPGMRLGCEEQFPPAGWEITGAG